MSNQTWAAEPGNAPPAKTAQSPVLNEKDLFPYKQKGRGTLAGQAFLGSPSGKAITQAGAPVHLIPITPYTRHWFEHSVKTTSCSTADTSTTSPEGAVAPRTSTDCTHEALTRLQTEKRLAPYLRTTRANPTGKITPAEKGRLVFKDFELATPDKAVLYMLYGEWPSRHEPNPKGKEFRLFGEVTSNFERVNGK